MERGAWSSVPARSEDGLGGVKGGASAKHTWKVLRLTLRDGMAILSSRSSGMVVWLQRLQ